MTPSLLHINWSDEGGAREEAHTVAARGKEVYAWVCGEGEHTGRHAGRRTGGQVAEMVGPLGIVLHADTRM